MPADQIRNRTVGCKMSDSEYERLSAVVESEGMTLGEWCREVLLERADGRIRGLLNIKNNSTDYWDFSYRVQYHNDTWTRCGKEMNAAQFANYIAGFQGAAYDRHYFNPFLPSPPFLPPGFASAAVATGGLLFHLLGATTATNDKLDVTGSPDVIAGGLDGLSFIQHPSKCGCSK